MLAQLRPAGGATVTMLQASFQDARGPLPHDLPDATLLSLALSFRLLEDSDAAEEHSDAAAAMFAVATTMLNLQAPPPRAQLQLDHDALMRCLRLYQNTLEREIVARIVGVSHSMDSQRLLDSLRAEISGNRCAS